MIKCKKSNDTLSKRTDIMKPYNILVPGKYLKKVEIKLCYVCSKELITIQRLVSGGTSIMGTTIMFTPLWE